MKFEVVLTTDKKPHTSNMTLADAVQFLVDLGYDYTVAYNRLSRKGRFVFNDEVGCGVVQTQK